MGKPTGFKDYNRKVPEYRPVEERLADFNEVTDGDLSEQDLREQGARCMDCGVPFCHTGCPLANIPPDFNDFVYNGMWGEAYDRLRATNCFPEFTGKVCPAPCEEACVLGIHEPAVTIKEIEKHIIEKAYKDGLVKANPPATRTGKKVAVIGSGPSGLATADMLNRAGHEVTVFERSEKIGGLLRFGIPDFKMEKWVIDRRLKVMEEEGIVFKPSTDVGVDISAKEIKDNFDAVVLCGGSTIPRGLPVPGNDLDGVHFAMDFLTQQNMRNYGKEAQTPIMATDKDVIVIGGGDTGSDCVGTSNRHKAKSVTQFELMPKPPENRPEHQPWPYYPSKLRTSSSHLEGCQREWSIMTTEFVGKDGKLTGLKTVDVEFVMTDGKVQIKKLLGTEREWKADMAILAMGFVGPQKEGMLSELGVEFDERGNVKSDNHYMTSVPGVFAAGDMRRGQSLVVWAISEGREAARCVDSYLMGQSFLPTKGNGDLPRV